MDSLNKKILFVDDDPNILQGLKVNFFEMFSVFTALSGMEGLHLMETEGPFAVVVSDMRMPEMDGIVFLSKVQEKYPDTVRVMLTGNTDLETAMNAVNKGNIFRFITKPCDDSFMKKVLDDSMRQYFLIQAEKDLMKMATYDSLTKVYARGPFMQMLDVELERSARHKRSFSVMMIDIDFFKKINDSYGHQKGDEVLSGIASLLQDNLRKSDVCGRYGGEEFIVLLPETSLMKAQQVAEKLRGLVEKGKFLAAEDVTISIGISEFPKEASSVEEIIAVADQNLYRAKESGRNRVIV